MTIGFFSSASTDFSISAKPSASASSIIPSPSASPLLPLVLDMTKPFHIGKRITSIDNITIIKILKDTIWIARIPFLLLDKAWQYMLGILDHAHRLKVAKDITL